MRTHFISNQVYFVGFAIRFKFVSKWRFGGENLLDSQKKIIYISNLSMFFYDLTRKLRN